MKLYLDLLVALIGLTSPFWVILAVSKFIAWQDLRSRKHIVVHRNKDGSLKHLEFKEGKTPRILITP